MKLFVTEYWILILVGSVIFTELLVLYIILKHRKTKEAQRKEYEEWFKKIQSSPVLWKLYSAHWDTRWKTSFAVLIDTGIVAFATLGFLDFIYKFKNNIPNDVFKLIIMICLVLICLILFVISFILFGGTIGFKIMNIVCVSSETGEVINRKFVYPYKQLYMKNKIIPYFFVSKEEIQNKLVR